MISFSALLAPLVAYFAENAVAASIKAGLVLLLLVGLLLLFHLSTLGERVLAGFILVDGLVTYLAFTGKLPILTPTTTPTPSTPAKS